MFLVLKKKQFEKTQLSKMNFLDLWIYQHQALKNEQIFVRIMHDKNYEFFFSYDQQVEDDR